jgi:hypothetical protein
MALEQMKVSNTNLEGAVLYSSILNPSVTELFKISIGYVLAAT